MTVESSRIVGEYDERMQGSLLREYYGGSDYFNYGYWSRETLHQSDASRALVTRLLAMVPGQAHCVLDVACGMGATTRQFAQAFPEASVYGNNISISQLRRAARNSATAAFQGMDGVALGYRNDAFDRVFCVEAVFHFDTRQRFLAEVHRVLEPHGWLALTDILFRRMRGEAARRLPADNFVPSLAEYLAQFEEAGFEAVTIEDATGPCWSEFRRHTLRWAWRKLVQGELKATDFGAQAARLVLRSLVTRHYLLVSARKA